MNSKEVRLLEILGYNIVIDRDGYRVTDYPSLVNQLIALLEEDNDNELCEEVQTSEQSVHGVQEDERGDLELDEVFGSREETDNL